jgi:glycosyltransferase involved in cell wall biosynthesis
MSQPLVSVIVTSKNSEKFIGQCLDSIKKQNYKNIEIIVVDNYSTDSTLSISRQFSSKVFLKGPERSAQRNLAIKKSRGQYILYLDADMTLSPPVIKKAVEVMGANSKLVALYIPEVIVGDSIWVKIRCFERSFYNATVIDAVRFIKKDIFKKSGYFDEKLNACEDWDLDKRVRNVGQVDIIKNPLCHNEFNFSLKYYLNKKRNYINGCHLYCLKWGKSDPDVKKQFGIYYRFWGVFVEDGKWRKLVNQPLLTLGMFILRILIGYQFLIKKIINDDKP